MKYDILLLDFYIFLLLNITDSQIIPKSETVTGRGRFSTEKEPNQIKSDRAIHESYRPRHKYKAGTGHQGFSRRFARSNTDGPQCAVMYKNNEPVGILQPYEDSYRFLQVKGEPTLVDINPIPIKRKTIMDVLYPSEIDEEDGSEVSDTVGFSDDKYPSVFAKFKVDSRLAKSWTPENYMKRSLFKREHSKQEQPLESENPDVYVGDFAVEDELRTILDDMGLIDDYPNRNIKRAIDDENLEFGTNRINLLKEDHTENRDKRDNLNSTEVPVEVPSNLTVKFDRATASRMSEDSENEVDMNGDNTVDEKREIIEANDRIISSEDTTAVGIENEGPHETRIERAIRDKIHKLKEEVKKEIDKLRGKTVANKKQEKGKKDRGKEPKKEKPFSDDTRRKKRQTINTLVDEENEDIDPIITFNDDNEAVHVRRKRNTDFDDVETGESLMGDNKFISRSLKQFASTMNAHDTSNEGEEVDDGSEFIESHAEDPNERSDLSVDDNFGMSNEDSSRSNSYEYDESEFDKDNAYEEAVNDDPKDTCNCDHNSNECKCSIPSSIDRQHSDNKEKLNMNPQEVAGDSSTEHCSCDKKGNCNCASSLLDGPEPAIDEDHSSDSNENDEDPYDLRGSKYEMDKRNAQVSTDIKEHCSCNKNGDCKCGSQVNEPEPLFDQDYSSALQEEAEHDSEPGKIEGVGSDIGTNEKISRRAVKPRKEAMRNFRNGEYFVDFHPARYRLGGNSRRKRENFEDMVAIHGGRPVREHLTAIRERSMVPFRRISARRVRKEDNNSEPRQLIDMSDEDIFGALPQGFEGGLQRYKRVKRT